MSKRKGNDAIPCSSKSIIDKDEVDEKLTVSVSEKLVEDSASEIKKPRYDYNFWDDKPSEDNKEKVVSEIKIRDLKIGKL